MTMKNNTNSTSSTNSQTNPNANNDRYTGTFIAFDVSLELIEALAPIVRIIEQRSRSHADQIERAASSVTMNLAEGQRSQKGNQHKHYALAHGSANEVKAALHVARAWGWIDRSDRALAIIDRLLALLWRLTHRTQRN